MTGGGPGSGSDPVTGTPTRSEGRGLTLIEVLVALLIITLALAVGLRTGGVLLWDIERQRQQMLAQICIDNLWARWPRPPEFAAKGTQTLSCQQGGQGLNLRLTVEPTGAVFDRIDLQVEDSEGWPLLGQQIYLAAP